VIETLAQRDSEWRKMSLHICKDKDLADELVQEMYIKSLDFKNVKNITNYIFFVLKNLYYDSLKSKDICVDNFNIFAIIDEDYQEPANDFYLTEKEFKLLLKDLTWYERTMYLKSEQYGQRELSRMTGIRLQTIHRVNKNVKFKIKCQRNQK
jgi:DNA-directed RNA polymerase specialized sigma24 family protein